MNSAPHFQASKDAINAPVIYVIDDDEFMLVSLQTLFRSIGLQSETFASTQDFLSFNKRDDVPSCLVLDVRLRGENGLLFQEELTRQGLKMPLLFMTGFGDMEMSVKAMKAGAVDFLPKPFRGQDMLDAVTTALSRDKKRLAAEQAIESARQAYDSLTQREKEVMALVVSGLLNKQIAFEMNLCEITVKVYRGQAMKKMGVRTVADLVRLAVRLGIEPYRAKRS